MKSALIISFAMHIAVGFTWFRLVRIHPVRFIPRDVYTVRLVTPEALAKPKPKPVVQPAETKEPEEMPAPPERPKPKPKKKPVNKTVPSADIEKNIAAPDTLAESPADEQVTTGDISLDSQDFPFAYYLATVKRKIASNWQVPESGSLETKYCRVYFRVAKDGSISSPTVETSSGNFLFDQAALRAVVQASPLPPLPSGFSDQYLGVHFSFAFERE